MPIFLLYFLLILPSLSPSYPLILLSSHLAYHTFLSLYISLIHQHVCRTLVARFEASYPSWWNGWEYSANSDNSVGQTVKRYNMSSLLLSSLLRSSLLLSSLLRSTLLFSFLFFSFLLFSSPLFYTLTTSCFDLLYTVSFHSFFFNIILSV